MNLYEQITHKEHHINIYYDEDAESPREWCNLGTIYTAHRRYQPEKDFNKHFDIGEVFKGEIGNFRDSFLKEYIVLPVYMYDHSGQTVSTTPFSCPWDSGFFGIIAVSINDVRKEYNWDRITKKRRQQIENHLRGEIETYDDYLTGSVYRYEITPIDNPNEEIDSCGGFLGDHGLKHLKEECISIINSLAA